MGLLRELRPRIDAADLQAAATLATAPLGPAGPTLGLATPWRDGPSHLEAVVWRDILGTSVRPVTRAEAMSVPAYARARHVLCSTIARYPMRAYRGVWGEPAVTPSPVQPGWVNQTDRGVSAMHRLTWTVDDLIWHGWSCWQVAQVDVRTGRPGRLDRLPQGRWTVDGDQVFVDQLDGRGLAPVPRSSVVLIPGPHEGVLAHGGESIRHAADLQRAAGRAARHPAAYMALRQTGGDPLTKPERDELVAGWAAAREGENGGVAFVGLNVEVQELGTFDRHLVLEGRNAAAVDGARHVSVPADVVDAAGEHSLTYANVRDNDRRVVDYGAGFYMQAISAALSLDDVVVHGTHMAFDLEALQAGVTPAGQPADDAPPAEPAAPPVTLVRPPREASA